MANERNIDIALPASENTQNSGEKRPKSSNVNDLLQLALKIERLTRIAQQSVLLLMAFGIAVSAMLYGDIVHMEVLALFTVCSYILLRWGLPK